MKYRAIRKDGFRSLYEYNIAQYLIKQDVSFSYEETKIKYSRTESNHTYNPDFKILSNDIIIEAKGYFTDKDLEKHLLVQEQHPELDIRFMLYCADNELEDGTKYSEWCDKNNFKWTEGTKVPNEWIKE